MSEFDFRLQGSAKKGILLVHGLTGSPTEMRFVGKQLHRAGFTVYAPTLAGHCGTMDDLIATRYEDWVESLRAAIREFAQEVDEVHMAGICVGGALALYAAHLEGDLVKGVAIYSPLLNYDGWNTPLHYRWARGLRHILIRLPMVSRMSFGEAPPYCIKSERIRKAIMSNGGDSIAGTLPSFPAKSLYQNYRLNDALQRVLPAMRTPTLLIHAREDDVGHPRNALAIQKRHGGRCEIAWLEDSYHMIHVDQERHKVAALTAEFFGVPEQEAMILPTIDPAAIAAAMQEAAHG
jgi:carboxylesterase